MALIDLKRTVYHLTGADVRTWLSGLITNTIDGPVTFAALLTPQGKVIADFMVHDRDGALYLDVGEKFAPALRSRLTLYKLRADVAIMPSTLRSYALIGDYDLNALGNPDPRHSGLGQRFLSEKANTHDGTLEHYDRHRLSLSVPDSTWDFDTTDIFPADANMDRLNGVDFKKGCFIGQEVVSRMKRKTTVRKRMRAFKSDTELNIENENRNILQGERIVGKVLHTRGTLGMALWRLDRLDNMGPAITCGAATLKLMDDPYGDQA